jgi:hypothetical protein
MKHSTRNATLATLVILCAALLSPVFTGAPASAAPATPEQAMQQAQQVVVGYAHVCALMKDGSVWCWGNNEWNQMGGYEVCPYSYDPINYHPPTRCPPAPVPGLPGKAKSIHTIAGYVTCAVMESDKSTWCWAHYDPEVDPWNRSNPAQIPGLYDVKEIGYGYALTSSGDLWQLFPLSGLDCDSEATMSNPVLVMSDVKSFDAAIIDWHSATCAVTKDGSVKCWGYNYYGHLGNDLMDVSCAPIDVFNPFPHKTHLPAVNP